MEVLKFLGASVSNYTASMGWEGNEASMEFTLVEDKRNDDLFYITNGITAEGAPAYFEHEGMKFAGIITNWQQRGSVDGYPIYTVTLSDPRIFFEGISLILDDYTYKVNIPNLVNIYGYLESEYGFGGSGKNEAGIQLTQILSALNEMSYMGKGTDYTGGVFFRGIPYYINVIGIPNPGSDFRVNASTITFSELLSEIAEATSSSYFVFLTLVDGRWVINFQFISRAGMPIRGAINEYVGQTAGASVKNQGIELVNEVTTKFIYGGKKTDMYAQFYKDGYTDRKLPSQLNIDRATDTSILNPIHGYWGKDLNGNMTVTRTDKQIFDIDARNINVNGIKPIYSTDFTEMRMALANQEVWESFLISMWAFEYYPEYDGDQTDYVYIYASNAADIKKKKNKRKNQKNNKDTKEETTYELKKGINTYKHNGVKNPHFLKAFDLRINGVLDNYWTNIDKVGNFGQLQMSILEKYTKVIGPNGEEVDVPKTTTNVDELYNLVRNFAEENYARRYAVIVPNVNVAIEPDTEVRRYSHLPATGGYLDESVWNKAMALNLIPFDVRTTQNGKKIFIVNVNSLTTDDNRFACYARFDNPGNIDVSDMDRKDLVTSPFGSLFIRCDVEPEYQFINYSAATGVRAVVLLPTRITEYRENSESYLNYMYHTLLNNILNTNTSAFSADAHSHSGDKEYLLDLIYKRYGLTRATITASRQKLEDLSAAQLLTLIDNLVLDEGTKLAATIRGGSFATHMNEMIPPAPIVPNMVAIPLESQTDFYGPWVSSIGSGKTIVEQNETLVPWNFNSFDVMNSIGFASVNEITANMTWSETGDLLMPGAPQFSLGQNLVQNGPYISDISVQFGTDGITTTYKMSSWTPRLTKMSRAFMERIERISRRIQQNKQQIRETQRYRTV